MRKHSISAIQTVLSLVLIGFFSVPTFADTQVRIKSSTETGHFSEGYNLSVEDWNAQTYSARSSFNDGYHNLPKERPQVWIRDIGVLVFDDFDQDGYYSGFSLSIDVDSEFGDTDVYAKIYLEPEDAASSLLHTTGQFTIYSKTISDEYRVDSELRQSYDPKNYSIAIDIHDAWSDDLLDSATARGFSNLSNLPLESADQDGADYSDPVDDPGAADVVVTEFAAAPHPALLMLIGLGALVRRQVR